MKTFSQSATTTERPAFVSRDALGVVTYRIHSSLLVYFAERDSFSFIGVVKPLDCTDTFIPIGVYHIFRYIAVFRCVYDIDAFFSIGCVLVSDRYSFKLRRCISAIDSFICNVGICLEIHLAS